MISPLRILYLEDDPKDAERVQAILEAEGMVCHITRVEAKQEFSTSLEQGNFDLVLADYRLAAFDGISALKMVKEVRPGTPFIFVSGTPGEEAAIETLKSGATDYVLKTRLSTLPPSVQRALQEAEEKTQRKQAEEALRRSEAYLAEAQRLSHTGSWAIRPGGHQSYWSEEMYRIWGFDPQQGPPDQEAVLQRIHPEDREWLGKLVHQAYAGRLTVEVVADHRILLPDGAVKYIHGISHCVFDAAGRPVEYVGTCIDVTERKRVEEALRRSEKQLRDLIETIPAMAFSIRPDGSVAFVNRRVLEYSGLPAETISGPGWQATIHRDDLESHMNKWRASLKDGEPLESEVRHRDAKGEYRWFLVRTVPLRDEQGNILNWYGVLTDIEDRKRAEQARQEIEEQWKAAFESNPTMYFILDVAGAIVSVNNYGAERLGYTVDELIGQPVLNVFYEPDRQSVLGHANACFEQPGRTMKWEARKIRKDGTMLWVRETANAVILQKRLVLLVICEDITEQKRAEDAARRSNKELRDAVESIPAMVFIALPGPSNIFASRGWREYTGLSSEDTAGSGWQSAVHPDDMERYLGKWRACSATGEPLEDEARFRRAADGEYRWFLVRAVPLCDEQGNLLKWYGVLTDIEDRKRAEALLSGEKRILEMVAKGDSLAQILDSLCRLAEEQASGVLASVLLHDGNRLRHGGAPSLPKAYTDAIDGIAIGPSVGSCGTAAYRAEQVIVEDIATDPLWTDYREAALPHSLRACWSTPVFSTQGKVIATFAMYYRQPRRPSLRDQEIIEQITHLAGVAIERKLTQEALRRSESYLAEAQGLSHTGSWALDPFTFKMLHCSEELLRIYAFDARKPPPTAEAVEERIHPEDRGRVSALRKKGAREREHVLDFRLVLPDGTVKYIHSIRHPVFNDRGEIVEVVGTSIDVTEQKRAEEELRAAETRFRTYVDHATDALFVHDEHGKIIDLNRQACDSLGFTREELIGTAPGLFNPGMSEIELQRMNERLEAGHLVIFESTHKRKDETMFPVEVRLRPFWHSGHQFCLALVRDISERKLAEGERRRLHELEADLARVSRVSMMGELTASLAHEMKQPIAAAVSNAEACLQWLARDQPDLVEVREAAAEMVKEARRAAEIIDRNRSLYWRGAPKAETFDLNELIREMIVLLHEAAIRHAISIRAEPDGALPTITADRVQMQQVLMNLMLNSIEAMKDTGGELTIRSEETEEGQILFSVSDSGIGLPVENAERIFDAFFTTKAQGTGMGLSISRRIIESHGGRLWASANTERGATFHFTLPAATKPLCMPPEGT